MSTTPTPESLFRVGGFTTPGRTAALTMQTGDWMLDDTGRTCSGALGVLVDDAVGHQVFLERPDDDHASVTSELSVDVVVPPPWTGPELRAQAWTASVDATGACTQCRVLDADDRVVAVASNWGRFLALSPDQPRWGAEPGEHPHDPTLRTGDLLGSRPERSADGATLQLAAAPQLANPLGILHGGIALCASERTAAHALDLDGSWWAASVRVHYLRPTPLSSDVRYTATVVHRGRTVAVVRVVGGPVGARPCTDATLTYRAVPAG